MNQRFNVTRFDNKNGAISWRVDGRLGGLRIRRNFKTREEAAAERAALEIKAEQIAAGYRSVLTCLSAEEVRDAEAAFRRLTAQRLSVTFCVDFALANYRPPEHEKRLDEAVEEYVAFKRREHERGIISAVQVGSIKKELALLVGYFPRARVAPLTPEQLTAFCDRGAPSLKTYNNRRGILGTFFKFAFQKAWAPANPVDRVAYHRIAHRRGSARTLSAEQAAELMAFVEQHENGQLVPFFALCLFAGIRPCVRNGEIMKLRPEHINLDTGVIHVEPEVSKVRTKRHVTIQPNLAAWLRAYPLDKFQIAPPNLQHTRAAVARKFDLSADVMRHTFISMFIAKFRSMGEAALQAGNSETIIRKHYLDLRSKPEAEAFWAIMPKFAVSPSSQTPAATNTAA